MQSTQACLQVGDASVAGTRILLLEQVRCSGWDWYGTAALRGKIGGDTGRDDHQVYRAIAILAHPVAMDYFVDVSVPYVKFQLPGIGCQAVQACKRCASSAGGHLRVGGQAVKDARMRPQAANLSARGQEPAPGRVIDSRIGHSCQQAQDPVAHLTIGNNLRRGHAIIARAPCRQI